MSSHGPERTDDHAAPAPEQRAWQAELERVRAEVRATERRQRWRALLAAGGVLVAVLLLGTFGTTAAMIRAERARQQAAAELAEALAQRERAAQATGDALPEDELANSSTWAAQQWYDIACVYALASAKDTAKREQYAARAIELLRRAVAKGYQDADHLAKDTDLDPLRGREDFRKLVADVLAKAPTSAPTKPGK